MNAAAARMEAALIGGGLLPPGSAVLVAVSGGRDSMVLLHALHRWGARHRWRLVVAHVHHQLRGAEADGDQALVAVTAARWGLAFVTCLVDVEAERAAGESWEAAARRLRHGFLARAARDHGCGRVAVGHHAGDQAELFLLRLLRGAGAAGLGGMGAVDPSPADSEILLIRPMLTCAAAEVEALAVEWGVAFRQDASNLDTGYLRNRVRHELMPLLRARFQPAADRILLREQTLLRDQASFLEALAEEWLDAPHPAAQRGFGDLAVALQREVLRMQSVRQRLNLEFEDIEALRRHADVLIQIGPDQRVLRESTGRIRVVSGDDAGGGFLEQATEISLDSTEGFKVFGGGRLAWRIEAHRRDDAMGMGNDAMRRSRSGLECFDAGALGGRIRLRHWRPGDRFQPIGLGAAAKLQDLFTNARVPLEARRRRVLAEAEGGEIFWVEGLRIGECAKIRPGTVRTLAWFWERIGAQDGH